MNYRDEDIDNQISDPAAVAIFQADNTKMPKSARPDVVVVKSNFSNAQEQIKKKALKMLLKRDENLQLK